MYQKVNQRRNMTQEYGMTTWEEAELDTTAMRDGQELDPYMQLQDGPNVVRIITKPAQYIVHKYKPQNQAYGKNVKCSKPTGTCPLCEQGDKPKKRWLAGVIDRKDGSTAVLDMGPQIFRSIRELSRDEDYGDPGRYDLNIKVNRKVNGPVGYYTVIAKPPKPLTEDDLKTKDSFDLASLEKRVNPPSAESVLRRMRKIEGGSSSSSGEDSEQEGSESVNFTPATDVEDD